MVKNLWLLLLMLSGCVSQSHKASTGCNGALKKVAVMAPAEQVFLASEFGQREAQKAHQQVGSTQLTADSQKLISDMRLLMEKFNAANDPVERQSLRLEGERIKGLVAEQQKKIEAAQALERSYLQSVAATIKPIFEAAVKEVVGEAKLDGIYRLDSPPIDPCIVTFDIGDAVARRLDEKILPHKAQ